MLNIRHFFLALCLGATVGLTNACASDEDENQHFEKIPTTDELAELRESIRPWATRCYEDFPCQHNDDHVTLYAGALCLSGETFACDIARASQDDSGRIWRSPRQDEIRERNTSSRDMFVGMLMYWTQVGDTNSAWKAYQYLSANDWKLCPNAKDNRCEMDPKQYKVAWQTYKNTFQRMGLKPTPTMNKAAKGGDNVLLGQVKLSKPGYQLHLSALQIWARQVMDRDSSKTDKAARILVDRQPTNPFFRYIAGDIDRAKQIVWEQCPREQTADPIHWKWAHRDEVRDDRDSMGWDCIFMINLLLR